MSHKQKKDWTSEEKTKLKEKPKTKRGQLRRTFTPLIDEGTGEKRTSLSQDNPKEHGLKGRANPRRWITCRATERMGEHGKLPRNRLFKGEKIEKRKGPRKGELGGKDLEIHVSGARGSIR